MLDFAGSADTLVCTKPHKHCLNTLFFQHMKTSLHFKFALNTATVLAFVALFTVPLDVFSQGIELASSINTSSNERKFSIGLWGGVALVQHTANFPELSGVPVFSTRGDGQEPPNFGNTSSTSFAAGIVAEYKFLPEIAAGVRMGIAPQAASFLTSHERRFGNPNGASELGTIQYALTTNLQTLGVEPFVSYYVWQGLRASLGARFNFVLSSSFSYIETLQSPTTGGFSPTFTKTANARTGEAIPDVSGVQVAGILGLGYDISVGERLVIAPEVAYSLGLTPVVANLLWRVNDLRAGVAVRLRL
jgi:hypothetical protein